MKSVFVAGSLRFNKEIEETAKIFSAAGFKVLRARLAPGLKSKDEIGQAKVEDARKFERQMLDEIDQCDTLYIVCPSGYIGLAAALEIGFALKGGKEIYASEQPADVQLRGFIRGVASPQELAKK